MKKIIAKIEKAKNVKINWDRITKLEMILKSTVVGLDNNGKPKHILKAEWYMGKSANATEVHCVLWASNTDLILVGYGKASCDRGGALGNAIDSCGIMLSDYIDGVGEGAIRDALMAIARDIHGQKIEDLILV